MTLKNLDNLVKAKQLKTELPDQQEFDRLIAFAKRSLIDSRVPALSDEGKFSLAYGAAHSLAVAALRWHGYRSDNRYLVFQCLRHTVGYDKTNWQLLDLCHKKRNLAEYEGEIDITPELVDELIEVTEDLLRKVVNLGYVQ